MIARHREYLSYIAAFLVAVLLISPLLHASVPHFHGAVASESGEHAHGDEHQGDGKTGESIIWKTLHAALRHEDKKLLGDLIFGALVLALCASVRCAPRITFLKRRFVGLVRSIDHNTGTLLSRGVHRYRVFG